MAHDVFISYASEDRLTADAACHSLEERGIRCWIAPRDVPPGKPYAEALVEAIQGAKVMVLVFSASANASKHVPKEVERAASAGIPILPIRIESVRPTKSLLFFLGSVHWLDALTPPVEKALERLAGAVTVLIEGTGERKIPAPGPVPSPLPARSPRPVMIGALAVVLLLGALLVWRVTSSSDPIPAPLSPLPAVVPLPAPGSSLPGKEVSQEPLAGRWRWYNGVVVDIRGDGTFAAPGVAGTWQRSGQDGHYALTWPPAVDRVTMSADGIRLHGANQYGIKLSAQRTSGTPPDLTGAWLWWNGATVVINQDGSMIAGPIQGRWAPDGDLRFTFTWPEPIDQVTLSADGSRLSGSNQYGFSLTAMRLRT